jgi:predicted AAA+ superfamily ATPase
MKSLKNLAWLRYNGLTDKAPRISFEDWKSDSILQAMIDRLMARLARERLAAYPAVALVGPRQSEKTTLAKSPYRRGLTSWC